MSEEKERARYLSTAVKSMVIRRVGLITYYFLAKLVFYLLSVREIALKGFFLRFLSLKFYDTRLLHL